jgi:mitogen-activated protein kinase 1/3
MPTIPKTPVGTWQIPDRYQVLSIIGSGSYGSVCEARDKRRTCKVAIKRIKHLFDDLIDCKRILREIAILSHLNHPHVVKLFDVVRPSSMRAFDELYIVMELCDSDMKKLIKQDINLTQLHIDTLLYNVLVGLKYLHSAFIYHRDLKPANCLVNQDCSVKICDFGLSRPQPLGPGAAQRLSESLPNTPREEDPTGTAWVTGSGSASGIVVPHNARAKRTMTRHVVTRWYRAPELILLQDDYTEAIDLWSAGCIYAELLQLLDTGPALLDRGPLFPGASCFPLSPDRRHRYDKQFHTRGATDQLNVIFEVLGSPSEEDTAQLNRQDAREHIRSCPRKAGTGLSTRLPWVGPEPLSLLQQTLVFNPKRRISADKALGHQSFAAFRDPAVETASDRRVTLDFDSLGDLSESQLRKLFGEEIAKYHPPGERHGHCSIS